MKHLSALFILSLLCILGLNSCDSTLLDTDKYHRNPKQAVEALFKELPNGDIKFLKEAVKFKESDKVSDYVKNEFFKQLKAKKIEVNVKKVKKLDDYTVVQCEITCNGKTIKEKLHLYKENDVWKTEIGFKLRDLVING